MQQKVPFSLIRCSSYSAPAHYSIGSSSEEEKSGCTAKEVLFQVILQVKGQVLVDLFEKEPLKGNSEVHLHTPTKFGEDPSKDLGGDRAQTDKQTDRQTNAARFIV